MANATASVHAVFAIDQNYARLLSVAVRSLLDNADADDVVAVTVVGVDLDAATKAALRASWDIGRHDVEFVDIPSARLAELPSRSRFGPEIVGPHLNATVYACLFVPDLVGPAARRLVMLDADILVLASLRPLQDFDLGGHPIGAVADPWIPRLGDTYGVQAWRAAGVDPDAPYHNSGVMLVDLDAWRRLDLTGAALDYLGTYRDQVALFEQEALNAAVNGDCMLLPPVYNVLNYWAAPERRDDAGAEILRNAVIRHFEAEMKPWVHPEVPYPHFAAYAEFDRRCAQARAAHHAPDLPWPASRA